MSERNPLLGRPWGWVSDPATPVKDALTTRNASSDVSEASPPSGTPTGSTQSPLAHPGSVTPLTLPDALVRALTEASQAIRAPMPDTMVSQYSILYDTLRSRDAWANLIDVSFTGSLTPSAAAPVSAALTTAGVVNQVNNRLGQFPRGVQLHLCVRLFAFASRAATATGTLLFTYLDPLGFSVPLGVFNAAGGQGVRSDDLITPSPITDPSTNQWGALIVTMGGGGAPVALDYQLGLSFVYVHPVNRGQGYENLDARLQRARVGEPTSVSKVTRQREGTAK